MNNLITQIVVFSIDDKEYSLPLSAVERITRVVEITSAPTAPEIVLGIINVQGRIISVINLRKRFHLPEREINLNDRLIIAHTSRQNIAFLVDDVWGVLEYETKEIVKPHDIIAGMEYVTGLVKTKDGMNFILDIDALLSFEEIKSMNNAVIEVQVGKK